MHTSNKRLFPGRPVEFNTLQLVLLATTAVEFCYSTKIASVLRL